MSRIIVGFPSLLAQFTVAATVSRRMANDAASVTTSPPVVAIASWVLPGAGYWLLGDRLRGAVIGGTILLLFMLGLLIGGVRVLEVPGYDSAGHPMPVIAGDRNGGFRPVMIFHDLANKPWSVPQVLTGPVSILAGAWSIYVSRPDPADASGQPRAPQSHVRINEIGSLYCSVAGLLNLMAILDVASRATRRKA